LQQRAASITQIFAHVSPKLQQLRKATGALPEEEALDLIDELHQTLEALWELEASDAPGQWLAHEQCVECFATLLP